MLIWYCVLLQLKSQVFYDEALRCQHLMAEQQHEHSLRLQEMRHEHSRKVARMQSKVSGLHEELTDERDLVKKLKVPISFPRYPLPPWLWVSYLLHLFTLHHVTKPKSCGVLLIEAIDAVRVTGRAETYIHHDYERSPKWSSQDVYGRSGRGQDQFSRRFFGLCGDLFFVRTEKELHTFTVFIDDSFCSFKIRTHI